MRSFASIYPTHAAAPLLGGHAPQQLSDIVARLCVLVTVVPLPFVFLRTGQAFDGRASVCRGVGAEAVFGGSLCRGMARRGAP